ncbi:NADP-dependent oxidoreductase [Microbacterium saperdae]
MSSPLFTDVNVASAVTHDRFGDVGTLRLCERPEPPLAKGQVRITVHVAGLNPVDWQIVESESLAAAFGITVPSGFGNDFAGVIVERHPTVTRWRVGDRVFGGARGAAVATSLILNEHHGSLHRTPDRIDDLTAGVLDIAGRTASAVADALEIHSGDTVLVGAAAGGVGSILTQLLVHAGATVIGTGSVSSFEFIRSLGAESVEHGHDLERHVRSITSRPIVAAADLYGTETALTAVSLGVKPDQIVTIEAEHPPTGVHAVNGSDAHPHALERLTDLIIAGHVRVPIAAAYQLDHFAEAVAFQRGRHAHGKVAITMPGCEGSRSAS